LLRSGPGTAGRQRGSAGRALIALTDGIAVQASFEPRAPTPERQLELVEERLARLGAGRQARAR
jgi:hypothetical protein